MLKFLLFLLGGFLSLFFVECDISVVDMAES